MINCDSIKLLPTRRLPYTENNLLRQFIQIDIAEVERERPYFDSCVLCHCAAIVNAYKNRLHSHI